jgi:hypothetical protein
MAGLPPPDKMIGPRDFPRVTPAEQAARDKRRMDLLKQEQAANLQAGEPDTELDTEIRNPRKPRVTNVKD